MPTFFSAIAQFKDAAIPSVLPPITYHLSPCYKAFIPDTYHLPPITSFHLLEIRALFNQSERLPHYFHLNRNFYV